MRSEPEQVRFEVDDEEKESDKQHHRIKEDPKEGIVYADYMLFTKEGELVEPEGMTKRKGLVTVLAAICKDSQYPFATVVPTKGGGNLALDSFTRWLHELAWEKVTLQVDTWNSMSNVDKVQQKMPTRVTRRKSPRYSSPLADGEMVNGLLAGKTRTWMIELSEKYKEKITPEHYIFPWVVRHSAWTVARFHKNKMNMKTSAYKIIKGNDCIDYIGETMPLGEAILGKYPKTKPTKDMSKAASRSKESTWER